jgi:hypothetical protein
MYAKFKNGVVFESAARDQEGLEEIEGLNPLLAAFTLPVSCK